MSPTQRLRGIAAFSAAALATAGLAGTGVAAEECMDDDCQPDNLAVPGLEMIREMMEAQGVPQATIDQTIEAMGLVDGSGGIADAFLKGEVIEQNDLLHLADPDEGAPEPPIGETEKNDGTGSASGLREMIAAISGEEISEETMALIEQMVAQGNFLQPGQDLSELFAKAAPPEDQTGEVAEGWPAKWYSELPALIAASGGEDIPEEMMALIEQMVAQGDFLQPGQDLNDLLAKAEPGEDQTNEVFMKVAIEGPDEGAFGKIAWDEGEVLSVDQARVVQAVVDGIDPATLDAILQLLDRE